MTGRLSSNSSSYDESSDQNQERPVLSSAMLERGYTFFPQRRILKSPEKQSVGAGSSSAVMLPDVRGKSRRGECQVTADDVHRRRHHTFKTQSDPTGSQGHHQGGRSKSSQTKRDLLTTPSPNGLYNYKGYGLTHKLYRTPSQSAGQGGKNTKLRVTLTTLPSLGNLNLPALDNPYHPAENHLDTLDSVIISKRINVPSKYKSDMALMD